jgi:hypothetical protein
MVRGSSESEGRFVSGGEVALFSTKSLGPLLAPAGVLVLVTDGAISEGDCRGMGIELNEICSDLLEGLPRCVLTLGSLPPVGGE